MEIITKYKAIDGVEFKKMDDCLEYEALIARVHSLMSRLKPRPENDGFAFWTWWKVVNTVRLFFW